VVDGRLSTTGSPIVCGDPHLALTVPGQWYIVHMECPEFTAAGPCNPCYPGPVFYGHNAHVAWTMTHAGGDRWDLYRERVRVGDSGPEALFKDQWEPMEAREEQFEVNGEGTETRTFWETRHGPVIAGNVLEDDEVVAARFGLAEPAHDMDATLAVLRARTSAEAREGFRTYDSVSGNFCFADQAGDIGYQYSGRVPKRPAWVVPVPGWDGKHEWDGEVARDELPAEDNPSNGFIVTANNRTTTPDYPHYLSYTANRYRADRLRELMDGREHFSLEDMPPMQADIVSTHARALTAHLTGFEAAGDDARAMQVLLQGWDGEMGADSTAALIYNEVCQRLCELTVHSYYSAVDGLPPWSGAEDRRIVLEQLERGSALLLGDFDGWDAAMERALSLAASGLRERHGTDPDEWRWASEHRAVWHHNLGRDPELAAVMNLQDVPMGGDGFTPFNSQTAYGAGSDHGVSFRQIFDLSNLNGAQICITPGNSGQPGSSHYDDGLARWADVEYHPLYIDWSDIEAHAEATLLLEPPQA
jgi:penicillin amidase